MADAFLQTSNESMRIIKYGGELCKFDCKVVIYGMGENGRRLYGDAYVSGWTGDLFVCDSNQSVCLQFKNCIQKESLGKFVEGNPDAVIVISIQKEPIVWQIYNDIVSIGWNQENIYQYIPETNEEFRNRKMREGFFNGQKNVFIMEDGKAGALLGAMVIQKRPFLVSRWGSVEGTVVYHNKLGILSEVDLKGLCNNAGVFPINNFCVRKFVKVTEHAAGQIDILCAGFWFRQVEALFRMLSPNALLARNAILPPCNEQWVEVLNGKKVLVIHPFAPLIKEQYKKREKLFENTQILPQFELNTYQAVQSMGENPNMLHG